MVESRAEGEDAAARWRAGQKGGDGGVVEREGSEAGLASRRRTGLVALGFHLATRFTPAI